MDVLMRIGLWRRGSCRYDLALQPIDKNSGKKMGPARIFHVRLPVKPNSLALWALVLLFPITVRRWLFTHTEIEVDSHTISPADLGKEIITDGDEQETVRETIDAGSEMMRLKAEVIGEVQDGEWTSGLVIGTGFINTERLLSPRHELVSLYNL